jgi:hypothetical protein
LVLAQDQHGTFLRLLDKLLIVNEKRAVRAPTCRQKQGQSLQAKFSLPALDAVASGPYLPFIGEPNPAFSV